MLHHIIAKNLMDCVDLAIIYSFDVHIIMLKELIVIQHKNRKEVQTSLKDDKSDSEEDFLDSTIGSFEEAWDNVSIRDIQETNLPQVDFLILP